MHTHNFDSFLKESIVTAYKLLLRVYYLEHIAGVSRLHVMYCGTSRMIMECVRDHCASLNVGFGTEGFEQSQKIA